MKAVRITWSNQQAIINDFRSFCDNQTNKAVSELTQKYRDRLSNLIAQEGGCTNV